jgi:hypothetical protein
VETGGMSQERSATYVYCVVQSPRKPAIHRAPNGLEGMGKPRLLSLGGALWLVAADAPLARYGSAPIERRLTDLDWVSRCALAHEAVVEHMSRYGVVIPVKLFTLFENDERALMHFGRTRKRIDRLIQHVAGRQEWGVQVSLDERLALKGRIDGHQPAETPRSGTSFLLRKKSEKDVVKAVLIDAAREAGRIFEALSRYADDERQRTPQQAGGSIRSLLDATFLVPSPRTPEFKAAVVTLSKKLQHQGYRIRLTGPWPPYTFVAARS